MTDPIERDDELEDEPAVDPDEPAQPGADDAAEEGHVEPEEE